MARTAKEAFPARNGSYTWNGSYKRAAAGALPLGRIDLKRILRLPEPVATN
jgi:hypothetical protein